MFSARSSAFQSMSNISNRHAWSKVIVHVTKGPFGGWQVRPLSLLDLGLHLLQLGRLREVLKQDRELRVEVAPVVQLVRVHLGLLVDDLAHTDLLLHLPTSGTTCRAASSPRRRGALLSSGASTRSTGRPCPPRAATPRRRAPPP